MYIKKRSMIFVLLTIVLIALTWSQYSVLSYADNQGEGTTYTIDRTNETNEAEWKFDNGTAHIEFQKITVEGIPNLQAPELQQDPDKQLTKYIFTIEEGMTVPKEITLKYGTECKINGEINEMFKTPIITEEKENATWNNIQSSVNIREQTINAETFDAVGSVMSSAYYVFQNDTPHELQIIFQKEGEVIGKYLKSMDVIEDTGMLIDNPSDSKKFVALAANNKDKMKFEFKTAAKIVPVVNEIIIDDGATTEGNAIAVTSDSNTHTMQLPVSPEGSQYIVKLTINNAVAEQYAITAYARKYNDLPDEVVEYFSAPGQYVNGKDYGSTKKALLSLRGFLNGNGSTTSEKIDTAPFSLGNFGGYVTYCYKDAVTDNPNNPYGIDFLIAGNSVINDALYAEPGNVYVSENGKDWYLLAGSLHYDRQVQFSFSWGESDDTWRVCPPLSLLHSGQGRNGIGF